MATELYGVDAQLVSSIGATPVSTDTTLIFVGSSPSGDLNKPYLITSLADYGQKLGGEPGDGYNLTEAAIAAFQIAGINKIYMIPVSNNLVPGSSEYLGDPDEFTGIYAIEKMLMDAPTAVNIICAPSVEDPVVIAALDGIAKRAAGHWQSFLMYDSGTDFGVQLTENGIADAETIVQGKQLADGHALAVWGRVLTASGRAISGAAVRACLQAKSDADYNAPGRSGGNLQIPQMRGICIQDIESLETDIMTGTQSSGEHVQPLKFNDSTREYEENTEYYISGITVTSGSIKDPEIIDYDGELALKFKTEQIGTYSYKLNIQARQNVDVTLTESAATELSADGICSYIYYGNGVYHTWGDHTSLFAGGTVSDELYRFDIYIRVQMMILNAFQLSHRLEIDDPMNLPMRNDITNYELDRLNRLKARGVLIGNPVVEFRPENNSTSDLQLGRFVWSFECTETPPSKYLKAEIAYTTAGLSVLTNEE